VIGVDGASVDAIHDVVRREEVIGTPTKNMSGNVEVDHHIFAHGLVLKMNPEEVGVVVWELISNARRKLFPCGFHNMLLGHPFEGADLILIF
jgi:hypothetical protein